MLAHDIAHPRGVRDRQDQPDRPGFPLGKCLTLDLCSTRLSLEDRETTLDLDRCDLVRPIEDNVVGTPTANRYFQPRAPRPVCSGDDRFRVVQLPGIAQGHGRRREQFQAEITAGRSGETAGDVEAGDHHTALHLADECLRNASKLRHLPLGQADADASNPKLAAKVGGHLSGSLVPDIGRT
jgi:hypothetical protein